MNIFKIYYLLYKIYRFLIGIINPFSVGVRLILIKDNKVVLLKHSYTEGYWCPGGGVKKNETIEKAIRREFSEEVGGRLGEIKILTAYSNFEDFKSDLVVVFYSFDFDLKLIKNWEIKEIDFYDLKNLPDGVNKRWRDILSDSRLVVK